MLPWLARWARRLAITLSALNVLFLIGFMVALVGFSASVYGVSPPWLTWLVNPLLMAVLALGLLTAGLAVGAVIFTVLAWRCRYWGLAGRVHYTLVTLAALAFVWWLNYWNLLGFRL